MSTVTGITAAKAGEIEAASVVSGSVNGSGHLILTTHGGSTVDAGSVVGPTGATGSTGPTGPTGAPTAGMIMYAGATPPSGWLVCDGSAVSRATYSALFAVIGTLYGAGNGTSTFNLPNMTSKFARQDTLANTGNSGGAATHTHTVAAHKHQLDGDANPAVARLAIQTGAAANIYAQQQSPVPVWTASISGDVTTSQASSSTKTTGISVTGNSNSTALTSDASSSLPPYLNVNFLIKT